MGNYWKASVLGMICGLLFGAGIFFDNLDIRHVIIACTIAIIVSMFLIANEFVSK